jgi:hypothetical protein
MSEVDKIDRSSHTTKWIPVKELGVVWQGAQRLCDEKRVDKIAADFDPDLFGVVSISEQTFDGVHHVIDGQHRVAVMNKVFGENERVPCYAFDCPDSERAAQLFDKLNSTQKKPQPIDMFRVRVTGGEETEVAVNRIITNLGYKVGHNRRDGTISAVQALVYVYKAHGPSILRSALSLIKATWGKDPDAVAGPVIRGCAMLLTEHPDLSMERMVDRVGKKYTPGRLVGAARMRRDADVCSTETAIMNILVDAYDFGLSSKSKLPMLRDRTALNGKGPHVEKQAEAVAAAA